MKLVYNDHCAQGKIFVLYTGYLETNLQSAATKQAMSKKVYYMQKNTYIFKLLLNIVIARIEARV
jgi:hypothetical protein